MKIPKSLYTPTAQYICTVKGHPVFKNGHCYSIDDKLPENELESIIDYMIEEGFIKDEENWFF